MDSSSLVLALRVALSLACVLGLMWFLARRASGSSLARRQRTASVAVLSKQSLGSKAGVALVEVGGRRLLLGVSEHGVNLLTEIEVPEEPAEAERAERVELDPELIARSLALVAASTPTPSHTSTPAARMPAVPKPRNPLEGSVLAPSTWRQAVVAVQERTIRR